MDLVKKYDDTLNNMTRELFKTREAQKFYQTRLTKKRAQIVSKQFAYFVKNRRTAWAYLLARSPDMAVKRSLLLHEAEELINDPRCEMDHHSLWVVHGKAVGLTEAEVLNAEPLPSTRAALYGWIYLAIYRPWLESLGGVATLERVNMDNIVPGGAHQTLMEKRWTEDLAVKPEQMPTFAVHREADADHKSETMKIMAKHAKSDAEWEGIVDAAKESYAFWQVFLGGIADEIERVQ